MKTHLPVVNVAIWVHPVVYIEGDVDYDMGNVESGRDVFIQGSVRSGFSVRAGGSVSVGGTVESGSSIHAQEDIVVSQGIVGASTRVVALGEDGLYVRLDRDAVGGHLLDTVAQVRRVLL